MGLSNLDALAQFCYNSGVNGSGRAIQEQKLTGWCWGALFLSITMSRRHFSAKAFRGEMLFLHPNGGAVESVRVARDADGHPVRERMLAHSVLATLFFRVRAFFYFPPAGIIFPRNLIHNNK